MSHYYLDASALVKRYVDEAGSGWVSTLVDPVPEYSRFTSRLTLNEVISAFRDDCLYEYRVVPPTQSIVDVVCSVLERYPLRAFDAAHLATALTVQRFLASETDSPLVFVSADERLNRAAAAEGFAVDDPNQHL